MWREGDGKILAEAGNEKQWEKWEEKCIKL